MNKNSNKEKKQLVKESIERKQYLASILDDIIDTYQQDHKFKRNKKFDSFNHNERRIVFNQCLQSMEKDVIVGLSVNLVYLSVCPILKTKFRL